MGNLSLPFIAGLLTTLSPCVLPVLPFVTASSLSRSRLGPVALALGLLTTFVGSSILIALTGKFLGLDQNLLRVVGGVGLAVSGLLFLFPSVLEKLTVTMSSFTNKANQASSKDYGHPLVSEFLSGLFLGIVWTPCSGPSLGAAIGLASQSESVNKALVILLVFGIGAVAPLIGVSYGARQLIVKLKSKSSKLLLVKKTFGLVMVIFGILISMNLDHKLEAFANSVMPDSWSEFVTKF